MDQILTINFRGKNCQNRNPIKNLRLKIKVHITLSDILSIGQDTKSSNKKTSRKELNNSSNSKLQYMRLEWEAIDNTISALNLTVQFWLSIYVATNYLIVNLTKNVIENRR